MDNIQVTGVVDDVSAPNATYHFLIVGNVRYGTYTKHPNCSVGDTVKFNAYQKGSYWNVSGNIDVVPSAPAPMQSVPSAGLPSKPAYNPVLANLGIRVGASMNQAVSCYAHGVLRREEITKFAYEMALASFKVEEAVTQAKTNPQPPVTQPQVMPQNPPPKLDNFDDYRPF